VAGARSKKAAQKEDEKDFQRKEYDKMQELMKQQLAHRHNAFSKTMANAAIVCLLIALCVVPIKGFRALRAFDYSLGAL
jgi:hypothetical protein